MRCIYCLEDKEAPFFQKAEHVLPQSFGKFEQNFTLRDMVCARFKILGVERAVYKQDLKIGGGRIK